MVSVDPDKTNTMYVRFFELASQRGLADTRMRQWVAPDDPQPLRFELPSSRKSLLLHWYDCCVFAGERDPDRLLTTLLGAFLNPDFAILCAKETMLWCAFRGYATANTPGEKKRSEQCVRLLFTRTPRTMARISHWWPLSAPRWLWLDLDTE